MKTEFRISKEAFELIYRTLNVSLNEEKLKYQSKECAEYLLKDIQNHILNSGTTRKNWQVVDYNDPSFELTTNRQQYDHYGEFK